MENFKIIKETEDTLEFQLPNQDHGFSNLLVNALWKQKGVVAAAYNISHPLIGVPTILLQVEKKQNAKKILEAALKSIVDENLALKKQIAKLN